MPRQIFVSIPNFEIEVLDPLGIFVEKATTQTIVQVQKLPTFS